MGGLVSVKRKAISLIAGALALPLLLAGCERPPVETTQLGYRGVSMQQTVNPRTEKVKAANLVIPEAIPAAEPGSPNVTTVYKNVQVLGDLSVAEFTRVMVAVTAWVSPEQGCNYCHAGGNFADDSLYTKIVARKMFQMTRAINTDWKAHVADTGVTCYTCHRGNPVPENIWFANPGSRQAGGVAAGRGGQNMPAKSVALASLPYDPFTPFLLKSGEIRVQPTSALPEGTRPASIVQTETTYGLMTHMSDGLGVNCTYCHNSQAFSSWEKSPPQRTTAWHGIRMARAINNEYLEPLGSTYPHARLGPLGDSPKANCATCHQGASKPLGGAQMLKDYPELASAKAGAVKPVTAPQQEKAAKK